MAQPHWLCQLPSPCSSPTTSLLILNKPHVPQGLCPGHSFCLTLSMPVLCMAYSLSPFQSWFKCRFDSLASEIAIAEKGPLLLLCPSPWYFQQFAIFCRVCLPLLEFQGSDQDFCSPRAGAHKGGGEHCPLSPISEVRRTMCGCDADKSYRC